MNVSRPTAKGTCPTSAERATYFSEEITIETQHDMVWCTLPLYGIYVAGDAHCMAFI